MIQKLKNKSKQMYITLSYFLSVFAWELFEELIEEGLAWGITTLAFKVASIFGVVVVTQLIKVLIKNSIKKLTYKEGQDKMSFVKKIFQWIFANKKSLLGTLSATAGSAIAVLEGSGTVDVLSTLPALNAYGFNITPILFYGVLLALMLVGVKGKGFEAIKTFAERTNILKADKILAKDEKARQKLVDEQYKKLVKAQEAEQKAKLLTEISARTPKAVENENIEKGA